MLRVGPNLVVVNNLELQRAELRELRPNFPMPDIDEVVGYDGERHVRNKNGRQYSAVTPWPEADALLEDKTLEDDLDALRNPPRPIEALKADKQAEVNYLRDVKRAAPVRFDGRPYAAGYGPAASLALAAIAATTAISVGSPFEVRWITADNARVTLSAPDVLALGQVMAARDASLFHAARDHKDAIKKLASPGEVEAYDIEAGWPEQVEET